ncbi:hypothetical protein CI109_105409 [Kwoniella shandongensis]|uniref:NAD(P)-binding domain-containing protein n=1 Tax=Kwoniella shandongensis TaxID=1734106 RepID=A0A5M6BNA0_9TREE|nr:uncharacterized protein CI109_007285 [Kwoniella shandongensis]KAA5524374.1 hypothetical protein CI109_007285 [Kwoniella shandongensis]
MVNVFLTGANGRIGSHVTRQLVSRGHTVTGLVRTNEGASFVKSFVNNHANLTPLIGDLSDHDLLVSNAKSHDAFIHCAMEHKANPLDAATHEREIVNLIGDALAGSNKSFIISGVTAPIGAPGDESTEPTTGKMLRALTDIDVRALKNKGVRSATIRLATITHDSGSIHPFLGTLISAADKLGYIPYVGDNYWGTGHSDDAALLFALVLEKGEAGIAAHEVAEKVKVKDIAEALAKKTGRKAGDIPLEKLGELGFVGGILANNQTHLSAEWTKKTFGWEPKGQGLLEEIDAAPKEYFGAGAFPH